MNNRPDILGIRLGILRILKAIKLPSGWAYRILLKGDVGRCFKIGRGSCLLGRSVAIGNGVTIGKNSDITAESIILGDGVTIGSGVKIRTKRLVMAKGSRIDDNTTVHGIGTSRSALEMGEFSWLYSFCHINTDDAVIIGDRTAAGSHCLIFTHSSYLPITHGYPVTIAPVILGSDVWLPWHAFILPGSKIGSGSTVGAFSLVAGEVPANSLAVGVPARVVKDADSYRRKYTKEQMVTLCERITRDVLDLVMSSFRPRDLFFPESRHFVEIAPGYWDLNDGDGLVSVILLPLAGEAMVESHKSLNRALVVTCGEENSPNPDWNWCDLVTQHSAHHSAMPALLQEFMSGYSRFGIRFAWHFDAPRVKSQELLTKSL